MKKSYKKFKYSLVEMLAVIAIIGILLAVTVPGFLKGMRGDVVVRAGRTLSSALLKARAEAIINRKNVYLIFYPHDDSSNRQYIGIKVGDNPNAEWYELPQEARIAYAASGSRPTGLPNANPWNDFSNNATSWIKWKNGNFFNANQCRYITFSQDGKVIPNDNFYFIITDRENNDWSYANDGKNDTAAELELNRFTGDVKWL